MYLPAFRWLHPFRTNCTTFITLCALSQS